MEIARTKQEVVSSGSHSSKDLPFEIVLNILSRVPAKSLFHFRCVSKLFYKLIDDPSLVAMHLHHTVTIEEPPLVMVHSKSLSQSSTLMIISPYSRYDGSFSKELLSIETKYELEFASGGLVCFKDSSSSRGPALVCNPLRGEAIELPHCNVKALCQELEWYGFGVDAATGTYQIVNVVFGIDRSYSVHVHVLGTSSWRRVSVAPPCWLSKQNAFAHIGYMETHWLLIAQRILCFDFSEEKFIWIPHPDLPSNRFVHLCNLRGSLAIVNSTSVSVPMVEVWILKSSDEKKECWVRDHNIKLHAGPCHFNEWWPLYCFLMVDDSSRQ